MTLELDSPVLDGRLRGELRQARRDFLVALEPVRASVYRYCRSLTSNVWDAEDLLQETLAKALADASQRHEPIVNTQAWLIRIATNIWLDSLRRSGRITPADGTDVGMNLPDDTAVDPLVNVAVEEALRQLLLALPPQERACVVLKDVFSYPLAEIAGILDTTTGAVKSALHRGRAALQAAQAEGRPAPARLDTAVASRPTPHAAVLRQLADAFAAYDIETMVRLFLSTGRTDVVGNVSETGHEQIRTGSMSHTFGPDAAELYRPSIHWFDGEEVILLWERPKNAPDSPEVVADVLRIRCVEGEPLIAALNWYFFCPELIAEVAGGLGLPFKTNGVSYF
ncbi:RNA polymerase sigma factor [Arthrobacter sp. APC 3897]|uniref:RNA polymerase sigma factor n=1 Tax=Arthrobacter sp. APC 3897 TaxID=3035204 RepID=UPI0025B2F447|nr:RNA polymerase sigma factor [Arthrobacter sp. APC 3897]MDN3482060.1 RNA polymerase sigma factor [Arthrobacter sp. APC 3897]